MRRFFLAGRRRQTRFDCDWSSDVCSSDLPRLARSGAHPGARRARARRRARGGAGVLRGAGAPRPVLSTVRGLARHLRICPSTLMSRFYRVGLPSPKTYLAGMRLLHAAYLFLNPGLSVSDVAYRLDYSSPQSFGRHLKAMLGVTAGEFRRRFPFDVSLARYVDLLVTPYRASPRAFHPFNAGMWDQGTHAARASWAG